MTLEAWIYVALATHLTNISTTIYLHRCMSHGGIEVHPLLAVPMRIWLWITTSMNTREWVAVHRKHHSYTERDGDPHSPKLFGIWKVALAGWWLYNRASKDKEMLEKYGKGTPDDFLERKILAPMNWAGLMILALFNLGVFGLKTGALCTLIQYLWMPIMGDVINGIGHFVGYRNTDTRDWSKNIVPWGILIAGEELHNNHHADPRSPMFRMKWYEFDIGWMYIRLFSALGLIRIMDRERPRVQVPNFRPAAAEI